MAKVSLSVLMSARATYGKDKDRRLYNNVVQFSPPSFPIDMKVVTSFNANDHLQDVGDGNVASPIPVGELHDVAGLW